MNRLITLCVAFLLTALSGGASVFAQGGYVVKGVVVDELGPVVGATVLGVATTNGTATDMDGAFVLTVSSAHTLVEDSCLGYGTKNYN